MPVTAQKTVSYVLIRLTIDMDEMAAHVVLREMIDNAGYGTKEFTIEGTDFLAYLGAQVTPGTRADDATLAIYEYAVAHGHVAGVVS